MQEFNQDQIDRALSILVPWMATHDLKVGQHLNLEGCAFSVSFLGPEIGEATPAVVALLTHAEAANIFSDADFDAAVAMMGERALADYQSLLAAGPPPF